MLMLAKAILRSLGEEERATCRAPFVAREARLPTLIWPRRAPVDGEPGAVITAGNASQRFSRTWKNQREVTVFSLLIVDLLRCSDTLASVHSRRYEIDV
jgi:haloalkane dehalogenase